MSFIDDLRQRPEEERLAFASLAAGFVALVLFLVWGITFFGSENNTARIQVDEQSASATDGLRAAGTEIGTAVGEFSAQYDQFKRALEEAGLQEEASTGRNTVDLYVDDNGDVHVDNIIIEEEELSTEN